MNREEVDALSFIVFEGSAYERGRRMCEKMCIRDRDDTIAKGNTVSMIRGLGTSLGKHGVIVNGVQACKTVPINVITKTTVYLNGKYGYILAGESINMNE